MRASGASIACAVLALLAGCGTEDPSDAAADPATPVSTPTAMPAAIPVPSGEVTTLATVLDDGRGPELCVGGVDLSLPPQCGGPRLIGFDWADHAGGFEDVNGTKWGEFGVTGTFDGTDFTVTSVVPADEYDAGATPPERDFTTPCPEPEGGWVLDPERTTEATQNEAFRVAQRLPDFGELWVDQSINPVADDESDGIEWELAMNDPRYTIINVRVTDDPDAAEAAIREVWGGPLCVTEAKHTDHELRGIQEAMTELPGMLSSGTGGDRVEVSVVFDDGTIQAWADREYGEGTVRISSALRLVGAE